ncbi:MAG: ComEC/Rec2 family competence protein [Candidatus Gracilibacteria bacterium]|nr:ComEC/Rec2 family competence protein [Candidatus Gracilibacteria bacterium]
MSKNKIFINFLVGFFIGILFGNFLFNIYLITFFYSITMIFFGLIYFKFKKYHLFLIILAFGVFIGLNYSAVNNYFISKNISKVKLYYDEEVNINAYVVDIYKKTSNYNSYILKTNFIENKNINLQFLLYVKPNLSLENNQIINIKGNLKEIKNTSSNFNYVKFLQSKNIYFALYYPEIEFNGNKKVSYLFNKVLDFKKGIIKITKEVYPKNEADFLLGLLIGEKSDLDENISKNFNNSGLTHIISVSGFNITIIIIFLGFLFKFLPIFFRSLLISLFILFFVLIVGDSIAVIRASIMGLVGYYILVLGRKTDNLSILLFTAFLIILYNPLSLNYDISFHLSFLAVLGLLYFQNFWNKIFRFLPSFFAIKDSFVLTMSALTTTLPIMIFNFGQISILSPISNLLVGGIIPFTMFFGFLSILGQFIWGKIGFLIGFINYYLLNFIIGVANFIGNLSFSVLKVDLGIYAIYLEIIYFMILVFLIIYFRQEKSPKL